MSYGGTYGSMPTNPRDIFREMGLPYSPRSVPQRAVDVPLVSVLPAAASAQDGDEVNLYSGATVDRYIFRRTIPGWVRMNDTVNQSIVTALPATADEGDQIVYDTGTSGVRWHLVYDTSDGTTYPWLFIGGPPLVARVDTDQSTASGTFAALTTAGPSVTVPLAGDYTIRGNSNSYNSGVATNLHSYDIGATAAVSANAGQAALAAANYSAMLPFENRHTGVAASTAFVSKYATTAGTANFRYRWISATPVRVG